MSLLVTNVQRFCVNDGPGIRTVVFLKGCSIKCPWCANPENISPKKESYYDINLKDNIKREYGYYIEQSELENIILRDKIYYRNDGGVTFSGGEPLLYANELKDLLKKLKKLNIDVCIETALFINSSYLLKVINEIDLFIIDIKILDEINCQNILKGNLNQYLENLSIIFSKKKKVVFRFPVVPNYTNSEKNIENVINLLKKFKPLKIEIFKAHNLAQKKYESLNLKMVEIEGIGDDFMESLKMSILNLDINCEIIKL